MHKESNMKIFILLAKQKGATESEHKLLEEKKKICI